MLNANFVSLLFDVEELAYFRLIRALFLEEHQPTMEVIKVNCNAVGQKTLAEGHRKALLG